MKREIKACKIRPEDNVAVVLGDVTPKDLVFVSCAYDGSCLVINSQSNVPTGHKIALSRLSKADHIIKYGQPIGAAFDNIDIGEHVHTHNIKGLRGRGDLCQKKKI